MGFNTVALVCNDFHSNIEASPKTALYLLLHPPNFAGEESFVKNVNKVFEEPYLSDSALTVMPTFHASGQMFYMAGQNTITNLTVVRYTKIKGKKCVLLELP